MPKMVILIKKKPGMSREDFINHYETSHAVLGKRLLGHLWTKYVRNYPVSLMAYQPEENSVDDTYDAVTETWTDKRLVVELNTPLMSDVPIAYAYGNRPVEFRKSLIRTDAYAYRNAIGGEIRVD